MIGRLRQCTTNDPCVQAITNPALTVAPPDSTFYVSAVNSTAGTLGTVPQLPVLHMCVCFMLEAVDKSMITISVHLQASAWI